MKMDDNAVRAQSESAYNQWCKDWRANASYHSKYEMKSLSDFKNIGMGKAVLCIANGASFEKELETIKELQHQVDILCCDKTLGHCIENGIIPTYCMVCDAHVNYETYLKPWENQLSETIMFGNICGNTKWADNGNWKERYFFVNRDILKSEREFAGLSGCNNFIPAGTNVSNQMVVLMTQCDNESRRNFFGYDKILLIGFDYCWNDESYYSFDKTGNGKTNYMRHHHCVASNSEMVYTSGNLLFSSEWLKKYIGAFHLPVVQCSKLTILDLQYKGELREQMGYNYKQEDKEIIGETIKAIKEFQNKLNELNLTMERIGRDHFLNFIKST